MLIETGQRRGYGVRQHREGTQICRGIGVWVLVVLERGHSNHNASRPKGHAYPHLGPLPDDLDLPPGLESLVLRPVTPQRAARTTNVVCERTEQSRGFGERSTRIHVQGEVEQLRIRVPASHVQRVGVEDTTEVVMKGLKDRVMTT